jgi:hypothetical protein
MAKCPRSGLLRNIIRIENRTDAPAPSYGILFSVITEYSDSAERYRIGFPAVKQKSAEKGSYLLQMTEFRI